MLCAVRATDRASPVILRLVGMMLSLRNPEQHTTQLSSPLLVDLAWSETMLDMLDFFSWNQMMLQLEYTGTEVGAQPRGCN